MGSTTADVFVCWDSCVHGGTMKQYDSSAVFFGFCLRCRLSNALGIAPLSVCASSPVFCHSVFSFVLYFKSHFLFIRFKWCWAWWQMWLKYQYCGCRGRWVSVNPRTARATERENLSQNKRNLIWLNMCFLK